MTDGDSAVLRVRIERPGSGRYVVFLAGDADLAGAPIITNTAYRLLGEPDVAEVDVNLAAVEILDSAGVRALLTARRLLVSQGAEFRVTHPQPTVAQVLRLLALDRLFGLSPSG